MMETLIMIIAIPLIAIACMVLGYSVGHLLGRSMAETRVINHVLKHKTVGGYLLVEKLYPERKELFRQEMTIYNRAAWKAFHEAFDEFKDENA